MTRDMGIYWLETEDDRRAVVVAPDRRDALLKAKMEDPTGGWDQATPRLLSPCHSSMTPRVVAFEKKVEVG